MDDIFAIQSDIAEQVFRRLNITLLEPERRELEVKPTENIDAYHAYLRGIDYAGRPDYSEEDYLLAIEMFERAVELDPGFALAYAELSQAHSSMYFHGHDRSADRMQQARNCVDQAFALVPHLVEAHLALGFFYYRVDQDWDRALAELATAERDLPNDTRLLALAGAVRKRQGIMETAAENYKRAFELSPRDASLPHEIGCVYMTRRCYADAARYYERSIALVPDQEMASNENDRLRAELDRIKKDLSPSDIDRIKQDAEALMGLQETEEDISCLPTLGRKDIPPSVPSVKKTATDDAVQATRYNQATSGIFYFAAAAGGGALPGQLIPLAPFFCYVASRMGTAVRDYAEMARRIDAYTGFTQVR